MKEAARLPAVQKHLPPTEWRPLSPVVRRLHWWVSAFPETVIGFPKICAVAHGPRSSVVLRVSGGPEEMRESAERALTALLRDLDGGPAEHVRRVVSWLDGAWRPGGELEDYFVTASMSVVVGEDEVFVSQVGSHGVATLRGNAARFEGTDVRLPVLKRLGIQAALRVGQYVALPREYTETDAFFCTATPDRYEQLRFNLGDGDAVIVFDRAANPFGPWPDGQIALSDLWRIDAAWKHGMEAHAIAIHSGEIAVPFPAQWSRVEVPLIP